MPINYKIYGLQEFSRESLTLNSINYKLTDISSIVISDLVTSIADNTFENLTNLKTIEFNINVHLIGHLCFGNTALKSILYNGTEYTNETSFRNAFAGEIGNYVFMGTPFTN